MDKEFKKKYLNEFLTKCKSLCDNNSLYTFITIFKGERVKSSYKNYENYQKSKHTSGDKLIFKNNNKKLKMIQDIFDEAMVYYDIKNYNDLKDVMNYILENEYNNRKQIKYAL